VRIDQYGDRIECQPCQGTACQTRGPGRRPRLTANAAGVCDRCLVPPPPPFPRRAARLKARAGKVELDAI
jgi:hypothetical protein